MISASRLNDLIDSTDPEVRQQVKKDLDKAHKEGTHDMGGEASPTKP